MPLFPNFTEFTIDVADPNNDVAIHGIRSSSSSSSGPPLLLLHGFPQTHHMWHKVAPQLVEHFTVIALDLRGYGLSSKPQGTPRKHTEYAKSTMARDCEKVMTTLGFKEAFYVCGHDRGGRVAHKLCVDFPSRVRKAMVLDIAPSKAMFAATDQFFATAYWHWFFLIQPSPFPESVILAAPEVFAKVAFGISSPSSKQIFAEECVGIYTRMLGDGKAVHAMCEDYRAGATVDLEEQRKDEEDGRKVRCDLKVIWAKRGIVEVKFKALEEWRKVCSGEVSGMSVDSGHFIPDENPEIVVQSILEFFRLE